MIERVIRIQGAADRLGMSASTIRRYERDGLIPVASRSRTGQRLYTDHDLEAIRRVVLPDSEAPRG